MSDPIRFIMLGGFLGSGKTTTLGRLARHYMDAGKTVGIVTNDQAADLVDTNLLRSQGFDVGEVAGACFCCNFDELLTTVEMLSEGERPDIILAEPVGSCTDLVATVIQPLKQLYNADFEIAPYAVILKPSHGRRVLKNEPGSGFSPKAEYILKKQIEEADAVLINRIDELAPEDVTELEDLINAEVPGVPVLRMSARTGEGVPGLIEFLDQNGDFGRRVLDIDYDIYAEGEAELGWLNASLHVTAEEEFELDHLLTEIVGKLSEELCGANYEVAHLKAIGLFDGYFGVVNLVSSENEPELSLPSKGRVKAVDVIVNARVACDPEELDEVVRKTIDDCCIASGATAEFRQVRSFRPGRPVPTHRLGVSE